MQPQKPARKAAANLRGSCSNDNNYGGRTSVSHFAARVRAVVSQIQKGETMTYKQVAAAAGSPNAARAVGTVMSKNFDPSIPCHRVVRSDGTLGGYNRGGSNKKSELLVQEKINSYSI